MNYFPNGTLVVGMPGSYMYLLYALKDLIKGKGKKCPKDFEVYHFQAKIKEEGLKIGKTIEQIQKDWEEIQELP